MPSSCPSKLALVFAALAAAGCGARTELYAPSPVDASVPPIPPSSAGPGLSDCADAGALLVYVVTSSADVYSFNPPAGTFTRIGSLDCPTPDATWTPFSMAVDHTGAAYVLYYDGNPGDPGQLYQVDLATTACAALPPLRGQGQFTTFGMSFVGDPDGVGDTLYVAADVAATGQAEQLATIDRTTYEVHLVGDIVPSSVQNPELAGTGDGRLFAFYAIDQGATSAVAQLDPATAAVVAADDLTALPQVVGGNGGWAFGFWGGRFYLFTTSEEEGSIVTRFDPADESQVQVGSLPETVVGAGVSTCAPQ